MRIGIVTGEYPPMQGGVGAYSQRVARALTTQGHHVSIFSSIQTRETDLAIHLTNAVSNWRYGALRAINTWADDKQLDVVNLQFETAAYSMSPWIHLLPDVVKTAPVVTTFHDLLVPYLFPKAGPIREWAVMRLARTSAGVITTNQEDMQHLANLTHTRLIPIGSNITPHLPQPYDRAAQRQLAGASPDDLLLAHFGFVNHSKGIETLLRAVSLLRDENVPVKLVMIGGLTGSSDPDNITYANEVNTLISKFNLRDHIHWTSYVNDTDVSAYLHAADAVVLPFRDGASYRRGSLMAAITHGCTIITTEPAVDIPAFKDGENMLLFPASDIDALMACIKQIQSGEYQGIGAAARELAPLFDWGSIATQCANFFAEVRG